MPSFTAYELFLVFLYLTAIPFLMAFTIPFFARRFDKFLPADPGTALVRSFHLPRCAKPSTIARKKERRKLWLKLISAGLKWGLMGAAALVGLFYFGIPLIYFIFLWICALLACIDEKIHVLPDVLTVPLILFGFAFSAFGQTGLPPAVSAAGALAGFLLPTLTSALMTPIRPRSLGGGDFKMLAGVGAWMGPTGLAVAIVLSFVFFVLIACVKRKKEGPYGASLLLGIIGTMGLQLIPFFEPLFIL